MKVPAGTQEADEYYTDGQSCGPAIVACYSPLQWQFRDGSYLNEWFIGDICSDDALKGGQFMEEDADLLDMENFRVNADNGILLQFYRAQYIGIARCNRAIRDIMKVPTDEYMDMRLRARYVAEAQCLRALYYMRLVRVFGQVPYYTDVIEGSNQMNLKRAALKDIWNGIITDLTDAEVFLWKKSDYAESELGHATKGTAQALLLKAYMTGHDYLDDPYTNAVKWGEAIEEGGQYDLCPKYWDNFTLAGENGIESVFEIQYTNDATSDWGAGGHRGSLTCRQQRARSTKFTNGSVGWGYDRPSQDLYNEFEAGDPRRDMTIHILTDSEVDNPQEDWYDGTVKTVSLKYAMMGDAEDGGVYKIDTNNPRDPINTKEIRYADVLLMYAEACVETGDLVKAKELLERVRRRARGDNASVLPSFPYGSYSDNADDLRKAVRHERRVELAMEGHRWFDLNRWGIAAETMNAYLKTAEVQSVYSSVVKTFRQGVNEIFPIPAEERRLAGLDQNNGY